MAGARDHHQLNVDLAEDSTRLAYNPALDGFRGMAVIAVVLYHTGMIRGGWIGVECFFVLSGYLITSLLVHEYDNSRRLSLSNFWRRRARRLLPALFMLLGVVAVYSRVVADPTEYGTIRRDVIGAITYSSNWLSINGGSGYWQHFAFPSPLRHMWSLAVEEQFYILYPILAIPLLRTRRIRVVALPLLAAAGLGWQLWMTSHSTLDRYYLGTDTRAFGILAGAVVAVVPPTVWRRIAQWVAPVAFLALTVAALVLNGTSSITFRGPFQAVTVAAALTILGVRTGSTGMLTSLLSQRCVVTIGKWSYGIYLVHWPMVAVAARHPQLSSLVVSAVALPLSITIAAASYRWIESPIRHRGTASLGKPALVVGAFAVLGAAALLSTTIGATAPLAASTVAEGEIPVAPDSERQGTLPPRTDAVDLVQRPAHRPYRILVVGDSVGASLASPLAELAPQADYEVFSRAAPSCSYDRELTSGGEFTEEPACLDIVERWVEDVDLYRPDAVLFVFGSWSGWDYEGEFRTQCDAVLAEHVQDLYALAVDDLGSTGAPVYFVVPPYWRQGDPDPAIDDAYDCLRTVMADFVASDPTRTALVDIHGLVCDGRDCDATADGEPVRADGLHFSGPGALAVAIEVMRHVIEEPASGWPPAATIDCC